MEYLKEGPGRNEGEAAMRLRSLVSFFIIRHNSLSCLLSRSHYSYCVRLTKAVFWPRIVKSIDSSAKERNFRRALQTTFLVNRVTGSPPDHFVR